MSLTPWDSSGLAFVVEGQTEKRFIQNACPKARVMIVNNGERVAVDLFAKRAATLMRVQARHHRKFTVLFDREGRPAEAADLRHAMILALGKLGLAPDQLVVGCPDVMIENWMLADVSVVAGYLGADYESYCGDGVGGKSVLKRLFSSVGRVYRETTDGVELLRACRPSAIVEQSPSAAEFFEQITEPCWWTSR